MTLPSVYDKKHWYCKSYLLYTFLDKLKYNYIVNSNKSGAVFASPPSKSLTLAMSNLAWSSIKNRKMLLTNASRCIEANRELVHRAQLGDGVQG